jgi:hypothetical protein
MMKTSSLVAAILALSAGHAAHADELSSTDKDVARDIAKRGAAYYDDRDWEQAREHFHRAYQIIRAPTLALMEARALVRLGRLAEATEAYSRAATTTLDNNEPYRKASAEARAELANLVPRVPSIQILVPQTAPRPMVRVDGTSVVGVAPMSVNPGTHVVTVSRPGMPEAWQSVTLVEGERRSIAITQPAPEGPVARADASRSLSPLMWTAFGLGSAGLVTGIVTGAIAVDRKGKLDEACDGTACPPGYEQDIREYRHWRTASWVGYLVGLGGLAGGAVILATGHASSDSAKLRASVSQGGPTVFLEGAF